MSDSTAPEPDETPDETPDVDLDEIPAAAGGHDDTEPEQGEGEPNSF